MIGENPSGEMMDRLIAVRANFGSHDFFVSTLDDGAGAVTVMEAVRALAKYRGRFKHTQLHLYRGRGDRRRLRDWGMGEVTRPPTH